MKRLIGRLIALVLLAVVIGIGWIPFHETAAEGGDSTRITDYRASFTVDEDGELHATETLEVEFPASRHGIFRFFDTRDQENPENRLIPTDVKVTRDGAEEPYERLTERRGRYINYRIGSADRTLFGTHTYQLTYRIEGALTKGDDGHTQFYWQLIPKGWKLSIDRAELDVTLPSEVTRLRCAVGQGALQSACEAETDGDRVRVETGSLQPNTPVTIQAGLDIPTPPADTLPWKSSLDPVLGRSVGLLGFVLVAGLIALGLGALLSRSTYEANPAFPLMYAPPEGVGPAQAAYILTEDIDDKAFIATLMYAAEQGAVKLDQQDKTWTVTGIADGSDWNKVDQVTHGAAQSLGVTGHGATFAASPSSVSAGQELKSALSSFRSDTSGWARTSGLMDSSGLGGFGIVVLLIVLAGTVFLGAFNPFDMAITAIIPGLFGIGALGVGATGAGTKRTPAGRDLWSRVGGFRRVLSTPSAQDRFDFSGRKELYTAYLPWAVAFDCADEWAKKYRIETGEEPPTPSYFPAYAGVHTGNYVNQMVSSFDSAVNSAISSYEATQSSSSSGGGGGFSGGGGGGGGGGGSW